MSAPAIRHPGEFRWETRLLGVVTLMLTVMGIASCYAVGSYLTKWFHEATQQGIAALIGAACFFVAARTDYRIWKKLALPLFLATLVGLFVIAVPALIYHGRPGAAVSDRFIPVINGARRWIRIGGVQVQFAEIARFTMTVWVAAYATRLGTKVRSFTEGFVPLMAAIAATSALVAAEPSMTMGAYLGAIGVAVIFTAGARVPHLLLVTVVAAAVILVVLKVDRVRAGRAKTFSGSALECNPGDQACAALIGYGSGMFGVGFGEGSQKYGHTPEAYSDYLLSVIGEEWGFVGVAFISLCFAVFCWMGFRIALTAPDPFGTYLASGLTVSVGLTAFVHAAVVTWLMPATGMTLPFMSVGRVSLILYLLSAGVLVSIGRQRGKLPRSK